MSNASGVLVRSSAVSEVDGENILRGVIDVKSIANLLVGPYQREALPVSNVEDWMEAFGRGEVPDIDLGMRGGDFEILGESCVYLNDPVYIVDGLQRVTAARLLIENGGAPYLGATVRFKTTEDSERQRFQRLNTRRTKLSGNVILANMRPDYPVVEMLGSLTGPDSSFVLAGRVTWVQRSRPSDLMSASTLIKVIGELHAHLGSTRYTEMVRLAPALQTMADTIGLERVTENTLYFFQLIDELWELGKIQYRDRSVANRQAFLAAVARMFSDHTDFWQGSKLFIRKPDREKLAKYPANDPSVRQMASSGSGRDSVYRDLVAHMNRGRRHGHLAQRAGISA